MTCVHRPEEGNQENQESFTAAEDLEGSVSAWLQVKEAADSKSEDGSSGSESPVESAEEEERGPAITSTGKKDKRKGRKKDRDSGIVTVMEQLMSKAVEQRGQGPGTTGEEHN